MNRKTMIPTSQHVLFLGVDSIKRDWPSQWIPIFQKWGIDSKWHSLGTDWANAFPRGPMPSGDYDIYDIVAFAKWRGNGGDGVRYIKVGQVDHRVWSTIGYLEQMIRKDGPALLCIWSNTTPQCRAASIIAKRLNIPVLYFEGAFFCSPRTWYHMHIIDPIGLYFQGRSWLKSGWMVRRDHPLSDRAMLSITAFIQQWSRRRTSKYDQGWEPLPNTHGKPMLFVPLQTPSDGTMWWPETVVNRPKDLVELVVHEATPEWFPVFKRHPRDRTPVESYMCDADPNSYAIVTSANIHDLIGNSDGVVTINSTVGIESLALGRRVLTLGESFYSGEGWTIDVRSPKGLRNGLRSLEANPRIEGYDWERLLRFLYWIVFIYLADRSEPRLSARIAIAYNEAYAA